MSVKKRPIHNAFIRPICVYLFSRFCLHKEESWGVGAILTVQSVEHRLPYSVFLSVDGTRCRFFAIHTPH